jgi:small subunit ribosomal protein S18
LLWEIYQLSYAPLMAEEITEENKRSWNPMDLDFTDAEILSRYVTETGKILPKRITKLSTRQQRHITKVIKRSRNMLLMK